MSSRRRSTAWRIGSFRRRVGVRPRILAWYVLLLAAATAITLAVERTSMVSSVEERVRGELIQEVNEVRRLVGGEGPSGRCLTGITADGACEAGVDPETGAPLGEDVEAVFDTFLRQSIPGEHETMVTFVDGRYYASSIDTPAVALEDVPEFRRQVANIERPHEGRVDTSEGEVWYLAVPVPEQPSVEGPRGVFAVAHFMSPQLEDVQERTRISVLANLAVLGVASMLAYLATSRLLKPVRQVTETAMRISENDLSRRIEVGGDDEASRLAATFNAMLGRLESAFETQRQFLDDVGHELRTPITIIRGNLETLPVEPVQRGRVLAIVNDELARMSRIVADLMTLAKAERPDFLEMATVDLGSLLIDLHEKSETLAPRQWIMRLDAHGSFIADPQRLTQAMMQLAENAAAHTVPGDRIELGGTVAATEVVLWVADAGEGIAPERRDLIFERFHRATAGGGEGAGLGLSIVRAIARAHGGGVTVDSTQGHGATVRLHIPLPRAVPWRQPSSSA